MKFYPNYLYLLAVLGLTTGCGQPGKLYLPADEKPAAAKANADGGHQPSTIPERYIDQAPPPINAAPPKPTTQKPPADSLPTPNAE